MHGFGPVAPERDEPVFHRPEDGRTLGLQVVALGAELYNLDEFRRTRENLDPVDYLQMSYYQSWAESLGRLLVEKDVLTQGEVDDRQAYFSEHRQAPPGEPVTVPETSGQTWVSAFEALLAEEGMVATAELDERAAELEFGERDDVY